MRRLLILCLLLPVHASAQQPVELIQSNDLKADVYFLSASEMAGRLTGGNEARVAANYGASEFMRLGLKPLGDQGTYFQNYELTRSGPDDSTHSLTAHLAGTEKTYQINHDFDPYGIQSNNPAVASGTVVFLGYGVEAPEYGYSDFSGVDVRGKIALILAREPQQFDASSKFKGKWNTLHAYLEYKYDALKRAGAAGVLIIRPTTPLRPPDQPSAPHNWEMPEPSYALAEPFFDLPMENVTETVANESLAPSGKTVASLQKSIDESFRPQSFEIPGVTVTIKKEPKDRQILRGRNVIAMLEGSDPALKNEYVLVLGGVKPKRSIVFLLFDSEEEGLYGAFYYVNHPVVPLADTVALLNADMIGRDENSPTWPNIVATSHNSVNIVGTLYDPELRQAIERNNRSTGLDLDFKTDAGDPEQWFARSDHFAFAAKAVPMVLFNTGEHPDYHTENDTWDRINYPKLEKIARLMFLTSADLANSSGRPHFAP